MRVLIVGAVSAADGGRTTGGIATHVSDLARALAAAGHDVAVFADNLAASEPRTTSWGALFTRAGGKTAALCAQATGLALTIARDGTAAELGQRLGTTLSYVLGLEHALSAHVPDVVHVHQADWRSLYVRLSRIRAPRVVVTQHSLSAFRGSDGCLQPAAELSSAARTTLAGLRDADARIAVSADVADTLAGFDPSLTCEVIPNGIDLTRFRPGTDTRTPALIAFVGRVSRDKGAADLIAAIGMVAARMEGVRLALAGPVEDVDPVAAAAAAKLPDDALEVLGAVGEEEIAALLRRASVLALPSHLREGQPRALLEAMASAVPVVATRVGSVPELLGEGAAGELVECGDIAGLAEALQRTLAGGAAVEARVQQAARRARDFDLDEVARRVAAVYTRVIT